MSHYISQSRESIQTRVANGHLLIADLLYEYKQCVIGQSVHHLDLGWLVEKKRFNSTNESDEWAALTSARVQSDNRSGLAGREEEVH